MDCGGSAKMRPVTLGFTTFPCTFPESNDGRVTHAEAERDGPCAHKPPNWRRMKPDDPCSLPTETWLITIFYDTPEARQCAARACDGLVRRFWSQIEFDLTWWTLADLDGAQAPEAFRRLRETDIVVVALTDPGQISPGLLTRLEQALQQRGGREGALIALCSGRNEPLHRVEPTLNAALHRLARVTGLDYLNQAPECLPGRLPDSIESYTRRAEENTDIMRQILGEYSLPPRPY